MRRVLKRRGLLFVNFLSVDDPDDRPFCNGTFPTNLLGSERFSKHKDTEADAYFDLFEILRKEKRLIEKYHDGKKLCQAYIDYIARKV